MEGNITFQQLQNIDWNTNSEFNTELSQEEDDNYEPPCLEDFDSQEEQEREEENPLPIPGPSGTHMRNLHSEHSSGEQSSKSMSARLERHLGTIIEDTFQPGTTLE